MAGAYLVTIDRSQGGMTLKDGVDTVLCWAEDATTAKQIARAQQIGTAASEAAWTAATATALAATADFEGWRLRVVVVDGVSAGNDIDLTTTGDTSDGVAEIAADMVTLLNATAQIAGAAYATGTLKVAETTDGLGDKEVLVYWYPPLSDADFPQDDMSFTQMIGTITDQGSSGDALTVVLDTSAPVPTLLARLKQ